MSGIVRNRDIKNTSTSTNLKRITNDINDYDEKNVKQKWTPEN